MRMKKSGVPCHDEGDDGDFQSAPSLKRNGKDAAPKSNKNSVDGGVWCECRCGCLCGEGTGEGEDAGTPENNCGGH